MVSRRQSFMYRVSRTVVKQTEYPELTALFIKCGVLSTNLYNAGLFRVRQNFTMHGKETLQPLEQEVKREIERTVQEKHLGNPGRCLPYLFLEKLMRVTKNPDFFAGLPMQTAQSVLRQACTDFKSWLASCRQYKKDPSGYLGCPRMPHYKKKGSLSSFVFTNQDCRVLGKDGRSFLKFPSVRGCLLPLGPVPGRLKQVEVKPYYGEFLVLCVFETGEDCAPLPAGASCGIDLGIDNTAALVSSNGDCVLYKGGALKSANQWYHKQMAYYRSCTMQGKTPQEAAERSLLSTRRMQSLSRKRNQFFHDAMHKIASGIVRFCLDSGITTIVIGKNKNWKQRPHMGRVNNQNFVQIPLESLRYMITYKAQAAGLSVVEQEESYTSKASLADGDLIPVYGKEPAGGVSFSGHRIRRGLYRTKTGRLINADLNGAGNILRKYDPEAFQNEKDFSFLERILVRDYPDFNKRIPVEGIEAA